MEIEVAWYAFAVIILSIVIDFSRSRALNRVAKETHSQALEADALHFSSDILGSFVVLFGLILVAFGIKGGDALAAIGVSIFVGVAGFKLGQRTIDVLVDAAPEGLTEKITEIVKKVDGVVGIEKIRVRPAGAFVFVEMIVTVNRKLPLDKAQAIVKSIEAKVRRAIPEADLTIHTAPLALDSETIVEQVKIIAANHNLSAHDVVVHTQNGTKYISFDLEVDSSLTISKAHQLASHLEQSIKEEVGEDVEINTHIEPQKAEIILGNSLPAGEEEKIRNLILHTAEKLKLIREVHQIQVRRAQSKLFISLHCRFDGETHLEEAHLNSSRFEYLIREELPQTQRVVVHVEPLR